MENPTPERLTFIGAMKELGFFPWLLVAIIGGPSVLVIVETVFEGLRVVEVLRWVVDGYKRITDVLGLLLEPIVRPLVAWIRSWGIDVELGTQWRPMFLLLMMPVISVMRAVNHATEQEGVKNFGTVLGQALIYVVIGGPMLIGAIFAGLAPTTTNWVAQGLIAALPVVGFGIAVLPVVLFLSSIGEAGKQSAAIFREQWLRRVVGWIAGCTIVAGALFCAAAGLSLIPQVGRGAGLLVALVIVLGMGLFLLYRAMYPLAGGKGLSLARAGFSILGGFLGAAVIVVADRLIEMGLR